MDTIKVPGKDTRHKILIYALSMCVWCKSTKQFLKDLGVEYEYIDVDLCTDKERDVVRKDILKRGGELSFPVIIVDEKTVINGLVKDKIKEALK
ncbi:MAG: glutaredoxin-like protein NrdH [Thermoproteota archaeon]|nr:glutaredoxin-like protein NrdH [Thermoproteota archaeon]